MGGPAIIDGKEMDHTDNFFVAPFVLDGIEWLTCEHYYQASKFLEDGCEEAKAIVDEIRTTESGPKVWSLAQKHVEFLRADWEYVKVNVMYRAVAAKYAQYPAFAADLAATSGTIQTSMSTADWQRMNRLILERVREELRPDNQRKEKRLAALVALTQPRTQGDAAIQKLYEFAATESLRRDSQESSKKEIDANLLVLP